MIEVASGQRWWGWIFFTLVLLYGSGEGNERGSCFDTRSYHQNEEVGRRVCPRWEEAPDRRKLSSFILGYIYRNITLFYRGVGYNSFLSLSKYNAFL
jgi:hypothetical protein